MDSPRAKLSKKGLISKTWERCKSFSGRKDYQEAALKMKSKSCPRLDLTTSSVNNAPNDEEKKKTKWRRGRVAPEGCFSVYVGPQKERFVIKTECVNHPLFKILLEEAESEYGYTSQGPLVLPCQVHHFIKVLMEMDSDIHESYINGKNKLGCNFVAAARSTHSSYHLLTPPPRFSNRPLWPATGLTI